MIENNHYTHLFHVDETGHNVNAADYLFEGFFLERNDSWYVEFKEHEYFCSFNDFHQFVFADFPTPNWLMFSPGACFIVESSRIKNYPRDMYAVLSFLCSYEFFPAESYMIERILPTLFLSEMKLQPHIFELDKAISILKNRKLQKSLALKGKKSGHTCGIEKHNKIQFKIRRKAQEFFKALNSSNSFRHSS
jgi:hypothetical protein